MKNSSLVLEDFVILMLIHLAKKPQSTDLENLDNKFAKIPFAYKEIIQNIMFEDNKWCDIFSCLINVDEYFDNHFLWEFKMSNTLKNVLDKLNKNVICDFTSDNFLVSFNEEELRVFSNFYDDEIINKRMEHFTSLLSNYIYTRYYKENYYDYAANSVKKVKSLKEKM